LVKATALEAVYSAGSTPVTPTIFIEHAMIPVVCQNKSTIAEISR
jgi:hypothetical protein